MGLDIQVPAHIRELLAGTLPNMRAELFNYSLGYMLPLEGLKADGSEKAAAAHGQGTGHSPLAPNGMVRKNLPVIQSYLSETIGEAIGAISNGTDARAAVTTALTSTVNFALTTVATDTPIDTGRARNTWAVRLPNGEIQPIDQTPLRASRWVKLKKRRAK